MLSLNIFQQSKTTFLTSKYLAPLIVATGVAILVAIGMFSFMFYPAQDRLAYMSSLYEASLQTQLTTKTARITQEILSNTWKALPGYRVFTDLSLDIAALGKQNHVRIPGMGYDFKILPHKLSAKGTFAFTVEGKYEAIRKFIFELERRWPYLFIEKLSVETSKKDLGVVFKITVSTFLNDYPQTFKNSKIS